jgi:hypothetical protein
MAMLGEKIGEEHGKVTTRRVLPGEDPRYVKLEITIETEVTILGQKGGNIGTYSVYERVPGQIYGEGQGVIMLQSGESAIWNGHGVGTPTEDGMGIKIAASVAFQAGGSGKLAALNNVLVVVEHTAAGDGSAHSNLFEWKA